MRKASPPLIGAFVVGAVIILVALIASVGSGQMFRKRYPFVLHFSGTVDGLREGASVKFKGVPIGSVRSIRLPLGSADPDMPIPVMIELDGRQIAKTQNLAELPDELDLTDEIRDGLRGQLVVESLLTGLLFVSLDFRPDTPLVLRDPEGPIPEIPTLPSDIDAMRGQASQLFRKLEGIDFAGFVDRATRAMGAVEQASLAIRDTASDLGGSLDELATEVRETARRTRDALGSVQRVAESVDRQVDPWTTSLRESADRLASLQGELETTLRTARSLLDPRAPLAVRLESALIEIERTARSTRGLVEVLERDPSAWIRGIGSEDKR